MSSARRLVTDALEAAAVSLQALSKRAGLSDSAFRRYRLGDRTPPPEVLRRLAGLLRQQAKRLQRLAQTLDHYARKEGKTLWLLRSRGVSRLGREGKR